MFLIILGLYVVPSISSATEIFQQTIKSQSADVTNSGNWIGNTLGIVSSPSVVGSITVSAKSTGGQPITIRLERCNDPICSHYDQRWVGYTSSSRTTLNSFITTGSQTEYTFNFTHARRVDGFAGSGPISDRTGVQLQPGEYWRFFADGKTYGQNGTAYGNSVNSYANGSCISVCGGISDAYFIITDTFGSTLLPPADGKTQIISFSPLDGTTTSSTSVTYTYQVYIAPGDLSFWQGYRMLFYDQAQPVGQGTYFLDNISASTTGYFTYSTTTVMSVGNHIINACLQKYYLGNIIGGFDLFGNSCQYHQFVVASSTFLGNLFQGGINSIQSQLNTISATSSAAILKNYCNPFSNFDIIQCIYALLIPTSAQMQETMNTFYNDFLIRVPWGYGSVMVSRLLGYGTTATSSLASSNLTIVLPSTGVYATATSTSMLKGKSMTFIDWNQIASSTTQNYWAPALKPLNNFLNIMMGGGFVFWLYHFFKKMRP